MVMADTPPRKRKIEDAEHVLPPPELLLAAMKRFYKKVAEALERSLPEAVEVA
jgi:hypothetical protein